MSNTLLERLTDAHAGAQMVGWDFSRLEGRLTADNPDWDFDAICIEAMSGADSALDLGTGGGERLSALCGRLGDRRPVHVSATEGWKPNVPIAQRVLEPLNIEVVEYDNDSHPVMPFPAASFDLVMARHESYDAGEVARVLRPGGVLLTQQVDGRDAEELRGWFGGQTLHPDVTLDHSTAEAVAAGLDVEQQGQWSGHMHFSDATALVEYMGLVPWDVPGFTVEPHLAKLTDLDADRPIVVSQHRYWFTARKPHQIQ